VTGGRAALAVAACVILTAALLFPGLAAAPFDDPGEGQHAEIARELMASGDWWTLRLNGVRYFDKPPLLYWLAAAAFSLWGLDEGVARLAPVVGTLLAVAATAILGARLLGPSGGLLAGGALLSSGLFLAFGRYVRPETLFVGAIQWGFTGLLLGQSADGSRRARAWSTIGCLALGTASLAKDPVGLVAPLAALAVGLGIVGRLRPLARSVPLAGVALLLLSGLGWYAIALRQPGFAWYTIVDNHLLNAVGLRHFPDEDVPLSTLEFVAVSSLGALPWILPAALVSVAIVRERWWRKPAEAPAITLGLWLAGVFALFAVLPFKLPHYALVAYPAIALLAARGWQDREGQPRPLVAAHLALFAILAGICAVAAASDGRVFTERVFSATDVYTRKEGVLGQPGPLPPWPAMKPLVAWTAIVFAAGSAALLPALIRGSANLGRWVVLGTMLVAMPAVTSAVSLVSSSRAVRTMAIEIRRELGPDDRLVHEGPIENSGALEWYSGRRPVLLEAKRSVLGFGATLSDAREIFWDAERFAREWSSGRRILLVTPRPPDKSVVAVLPRGSVRLLCVDHGRWLYTNAPLPGS
jgi:4-amino-4-deoxy-L-arabinose transferase-like glycosyltransferase